MFWWLAPQPLSNLNPMPLHRSDSIMSGEKKQQQQHPHWNSLSRGGGSKLEVNWTLEGDILTLCVCKNCLAARIDRRECSPTDNTSVKTGSQKQCFKLCAFYITEKSLQCTHSKERWMPPRKPNERNNRRIMPLGCEEQPRGHTANNDVYILSWGILLRVCFLMTAHREENGPVGDVKTLINEGSLSTLWTLRAAIMSKQCL